MILGQFDTAWSFNGHAAAGIGGNTPKVRFVAQVARHHYQRNRRQSPAILLILCVPPIFSVFTARLLQDSGRRILMGNSIRIL